MRILTRYVLAELIKVFLVSLLALTGMVIVGFVVREAIDQGLPPGQAARLIPFVLPHALRIAVPVTLLLAATSVYARLAGGNEVVAVKSLGIFPMALIWPTLIVGFLLSLGTVWLNDLAVSWGRNGVRRIVVEAAEEIAYGMLRTQRRWSTSHYAINVKQVEGRTLLRPTLSIKARGDTPAVTITAQRAELRSDRRHNRLIIIGLNGTAELEGGQRLQFPEDFQYELPLWDTSRDGGKSNSPSWLALRVIPDQIVRQRAEITRCEQELAVRAANQMLCGDFDGLVSDDWKTRRRELAEKRSRLYRLQTEPHRRWSAGFSCLCFVLVGAPMAIRLRNRDFLTSFFLCFAPILIVYYPLLAYGIDAAKCGRFPPCVVWAGNVVLVAWGAYLLRKVIRY